MDITPNLPSSAPKDGRLFIGEFLTDDGPRHAVVRFKDGKLRRRKGDNEWFDIAKRERLKSWGDYDPAVTYAWNGF